MSRIALLFLSPLLSVAVLPEDRPAIHLPIKKPTQQDLDRAEAQKLFALGVLLERDNKLIEALRTFEEALRLDPDATPILRALIPLYLALDRNPEVFQACEKVLEQEPDDFETGYLYARQLRLNERSADSLAVLQKLADRPALKEAPEMQARISYDLGLLHEARNDWKQAVAAFQQTADVLNHPAPLLEPVGSFTEEELRNQSAETYERLGRAYLKQKMTREATAAFAQAKERDPLRAARLSYNLAEVLSSEGEHREALLRLNEYLSTLPLGMEAYELKIELLKKLNRTSEIIPDLEEASGRDPHNQALQLLLAREYRRARRTGPAEQVYQRLIKARPSPEVYKELFTLYKESRDGLNRVLSLLDEAVKRGSDKDDQSGDATEAARARSMLVVLRDDPDLIKGLLETVRPPATLLALSYQTRMMFASLAARARQLELAERLFRSCLETGISRRKEAEVYSGLLRVLMLAQKHQAVIEVCNKGLRQAQATNRVMFHLDLAQALMSLGKTKEALAAADDAVNDSSSAERLLALRNRATLLSQAEQHEKVLAECQAMLKQYNQPGELRDIRSTLSLVYSAAKEHTRAEEQLQLILEADPADASANNDLGYLWADQNKNLDQAEKLIRKALELDRKQRQEGAWLGLDADLDNAAYIDSLGWVLFRRGLLNEARQELERASRLPGGAEDPVVWDHLGDVLFRTGEKARALQAWKKALELYEVEQRRRPDDHYRELKQKLRQTE